MPTELTPLTALLHEVLIDDEEALVFCLAFAKHCHNVDDIIDEKRENTDFILGAFEFAAYLYSLSFYRKHAHMLLPVIKAVTNAYADSVKFEKEKTCKWKQHYSDVLRQSGNEVVVAAVEISKGYNAKRIISEKFREISYLRHHTKEGEPI